MTMNYIFTIVDLLPAGGDASASGYSSVPHSLGNLSIAYIDTVCPRSSDPFYIVTYEMGHYFVDTQ